MSHEFKNWLESRILQESMNVVVDDFSYPQDLDTLGDLAYYLQQKIFSPYFRPETEKSGTQIMNPQDIQNFQKNKPMEVFTVDGESDYFGNSGVINFYTQGLPQASIQKFAQAVKFHLDELGVKYGQFTLDNYQSAYDKDTAQYKDDEDASDFLKKRYSQVDMSHTRVVRIPILQIPKRQENKPPDLNMSNANAIHIFYNVLGMKEYTEEGDGGIYGFSDMPAADLIMKIDTMFAPEERSSSGDDSRIVDPGLNPEQIDQRLMRVRQIAQWALDNNYSTISVH